jgi:toxin ParE1/3/4
VTRPHWRIRLGSEAEKDFAHILKHTRDNFGQRQVEIYQSTLLETLALLENGPDVPGSVARDEILSGVRTVHVARRGRRGRHFIMYRATDEQVVEVLRILHDAMDLARHIPPETE